MIGFVNAPREKLFENEHSFMWEKDGILLVEYKPVVIDARVISEVIVDRVHICKGRTLPVYVDSRKVKYWTRESRILAFSHEKAVTNVAAFAILNDSHMGNAVINWVTRFLDTKVPFKLFNQEEKAVHWLQQFKQTAK